MKDYNEYEDMFPVINRVIPKTYYLGYANKEVKQFETEADAKKFGKYIGKEVDNESEVQDYKRAIKKRSSDIYGAWLEDIKKECEYLIASNTFDRFFNIASENSCNYDEMRDMLEEFNLLAREIKQEFTQR